LDNTPAPTKDTKTPGGKKGTKVPNSGPSKIVLTSNGRIKGEWANGDTSHLNTSGDIAKYSSLPKYAGYYIFPTPGAVRTQKMHGNNGVDLGNKTGAPVLAAAGGTVTVAKAGGYNYGYGNYIRITHPNGTETIYGHLSRVDVSVGQTVDKGQQIGAVGSTGNSTGPHLHFEVRGAYNPWAW
jgi:murein DD-endopeptidase MepM/ murein hydrolase activator NlpD